MTRTKFVSAAALAALVSALLIVQAPAAPQQINLGSLHRGEGKPTEDKGAISLVADVESLEHQIVKITANNVPAKAGLVWRVAPKKDVSRADTEPHKFQFTAPPGEYAVELLVITVDAAGKVHIEEHAITVKIKAKDGKPDAPPPPKPKPDDKGAGKLDPPAAIAKISFPPFACTAAPIGPRRKDGRWDVLTAAHCVDHVRVGTRGTMRLLDGRTIGVIVAVVDSTCDVCWLVTEEAVEDMPYANLAKENPAVGTAVWHAGYGIDRPGNREEGVVTGGENSRGQLAFTLNVSSGDSGGPIMRKDTSEVVSCVCCTQGRGIKTTMYGGSVAQARRLRPGEKVAEPAVERPGEFKWTPIEIPQITLIPSGSHGG